MGVPSQLVPIVMSSAPTRSKPLKSKDGLSCSSSVMEYLRGMNIPPKPSENSPAMLYLGSSPLFTSCMVLNALIPVLLLRLAVGHLLSELSGRQYPAHPHRSPH